MPENIVFPDGMSFFDPPKQAPDWVLGTIAFNVGKFIEFADKHQKNGWLRVQILKSKKGSTYLALQEYKPNLGPKKDGGVKTIQLTKRDAGNDIPF